MSTPGIVTIPLSGPRLAEAAARHLLASHAAAIPDLSNLAVLVPNHRAGQDFIRALTRVGGLPALIPPRITPLKSWAAQYAITTPEPQARRLARLHGVLRAQKWLGEVDRWTLANDLLQLVDELSAARIQVDSGERIRALNGKPPEQETALIEAVWRAMNCDGVDPQACYASALRAIPPGQPIYGYALGPLNELEKSFLERHALTAPVTLFRQGADEKNPLLQTLSTAWANESTSGSAPIKARAKTLAHMHAASPVRGTIKINPAPHLEAEARGIATWVSEQLQAGHSRIALIALDRETARRTRALLERMNVLIADETGWTLSTTAAASVIDRWLTCVSEDFPHTELLDLLKSPFVLGKLAERQDAVLALETAMRKQGVAQGLSEIQRLAHKIVTSPDDSLFKNGNTFPACGKAQIRSSSPTNGGGWEEDTTTSPTSANALSRFGFINQLTTATQAFQKTRAPLAIWLQRLLASLDQLQASVRLSSDAAGSALLETLNRLQRELASDSEKYSFSEWRRWLNLALESETFADSRVTSPIVLTSLPNSRGRTFDAVALIGADAAHLPAKPAPGLFSQAIRLQVGLPVAADSMAQTTEDLLQLLSQGPSLLSWQTHHNDEANPASSFVLRLQALHLAAWQSGLTTQRIGQPPALTSTIPALTQQPAPSIAPHHLPRRYAASAYQTLLDCPYRFFVKNVLGIRELDEADDPLDKSDYGTLLHKILKTFHDSQPPYDAEKALARLAKISALEFAALPAYTAAAWQAKWQRIQPAYIDAWLVWVDQGWQYQSGETDFSVAHTVPGLGEITLHGRVDRVDVKNDHRAVIDYKTGNRNSLKNKLKDPSENIQLPWYAWLADATAAFLPINETPVTLMELDGETDVEAISLHLPKLLKAIAAGAALRASGVESVCQYCEARGMCRKGMWHE